MAWHGPSPLSRHAMLRGWHRQWHSLTGTVSCLRCSNRPSEMHQVTSSSYVAAAGWRPLRLPRPLSFDVQKVIRHCCQIQPPRVGQMHLHHGPLGLFHDPFDSCFTDGLGLGPARRQTPPSWGGGSLSDDDLKREP
ncbi:hypothetical protein J3F84DRAFT_384235 [Trichoderma pleuroticola]